jgi:hypothetical protein
MPVGFGGHVLKSKGRQHDNLVHLKKSIVRVNADTNCLAQALVIAIAKVQNDTNYEAYRKGRKIRPEVQRLLERTGIDLSSGGGIPELERFQDHFTDQYKIVVYGGLNSDSISRASSTRRKDSIFYCMMQIVTHVINNLTGAMAKCFVCHACGKG